MGSVRADSDQRQKDVATKTKDMKATDLRIGNLIYEIVDTPYNPEEKDIFEIAAINSIYGTLIDKDDNITQLNYCEPIPLTEEWLLKLGFKEDKIRSQFFKSCGEYIMKISVNVFSGTLIKESSWFVSILTGYGSQPVTLVKQYVHQIQNLYFELDKELKIKDNEKV